MKIAKNNNELYEVLKEYMEIEAMSRYEEPVANKLKANTKGSNFDYSRDGMGSLIMHKKGKGPKIMVAAHMDEVGFLVQDIQENGQITLSMIGGV
jgi:putative aminopeptidase FrvX